MSTFQMSNMRDVPQGIFVRLCAELETETAENKKN